MNEKMQPKTKVSHRRWQHFNRGDYYYGECPKCGNVCQPDFEQPTDEDHVHVEFCECEQCGCKFKVQTTTVYRYGGIDED
jgi:hypothetical protein